MKKVLITGVNGFVGSNIANYMVEKGYDVVGLYRRKVDRYNSKIRYVQCDLSEPIQLKEHFDVVIHLASQVENAQVYDYVVNTTMATANLISYCENVKVDFFILASSIAIYGETDIEVDESSDRKNVEPYGMAKIFAEQLLMNSSIPTKIILRLPRVLGVGAD
ncbi:MAG: NAD(P)-dependent oxidoreductase, partial [Lachnospiraceae bacterium]|nr:NAD(P)-dependent oxidoreductase [Lachnospiraceae bacterium]